MVRAKRAKHLILVIDLDGFGSKNLTKLLGILYHLQNDPFANIYFNSIRTLLSFLLNDSRGAQNLEPVFVQNFIHPDN